jgi:uncharacterized membrane protein YwaF
MHTDRIILISYCFFFCTSADILLAGMFQLVAKRNLMTTSTRLMSDNTKYVILFAFGGELIDYIVQSNFLLLASDPSGYSL